MSTPMSTPMSTKAATHVATRHGSSILLRISGVFDAGSMGPFTNVAKFAFGLRVERRGQEIVVSR